MTAPSTTEVVLNAFGVSDQDVQQFVLKYAAAWTQVPARLQRVEQLAQGSPTILPVVQQLQTNYANTSNGVGLLLSQVQTGRNVDLVLAAQTMPQALAILAGTDQVEQAVGVTGGVPVAFTASLPWWVYVGIGGGLLYLLLKRRR